MRALRIPFQAGTLYPGRELFVEYRPRAGRNARQPANWSGVQVRLRVGAESWVLGMVKGDTAVPGAAAMQIGVKWAIPSLGLALVVDSIDAAGAHVRVVQATPPPAPAAPTVTAAKAGNGFVPGVTSPDQITDPANPCDGAVPRRHSHFFTEDGEFGSLGWNGEQVDDGTYELIDENTFVIPKEFPNVTFDFTIEGDTIMFEPRIPDCSPDCFEAPWSVSVAYPGKTWERVG